VSFANAPNRAFRPVYFAFGYAAHRGQHVTCFWDRSDPACTECSANPRARTPITAPNIAIYNLHHQLVEPVVWYGWNCNSPSM
jgi:hypothetical protein